ncbi:MAG: succinate dehydrogenase assembly factor 2 [Alphaproteobacteria bacterium]|nr:succinate dehydrogenase assembly factor 2 [Alphaproteobacteria bacterium]
MFEPQDAAGPRETIEARRRRLIYRSCYTGMKETDLLLGPFAMRYVPGFSVEQLDRYERLLAEPDPDIFDWATGRQAVPAIHENDVVSLLKNFRIAS